MAVEQLDDQPGAVETSPSALGDLHELVFKAVSYPTMFVVGPDGKIKHVNIGATANIDATLKSQLGGILGGSS